VDCGMRNAECGCEMWDVRWHGAWSMGHVDKAGKARRARKGITLRMCDCGFCLAPCALSPEPYVLCRLTSYSMPYAQRYTFLNPQSEILNPQFNKCLVPSIV
jgi:hypothetical protein